MFHLMKSYRLTTYLKNQSAFWTPAMHVGTEVLLHQILTLELDGDEEDIYTFQLLYPATESSWHPLNRGLVISQELYEYSGELTSL